MAKTRKPGRPKTGKRMTEKLIISVHDVVKARLQRRADRHGMPLARYCREHLESLVR